MNSSRIVAVVVGVALLPVVALAQVWRVETTQDEFDGTLRTYLYQVGDDSQLSAIVGCDGPFGTTLSLAPGPTAGWSVFENGIVDLRFDDGRPVEVRFDDGDTILLWYGADVGRLAAADTLTVRVNPFLAGLEVDTFSMHGFAEAMERAGCAVE